MAETTDAVELRPLTAANWAECAALALGPGQEHFVAPNLYSIAEAQFYPQIRTRAIYHGATMVGFVAYGYRNIADPDDPILGWLWQVMRFMIDRSHQGRGLGLAAMRAVIAAIVAAPEHRPGDPLFLTYRPQNEAAARLYARLGFAIVSTGARGRVIARLALAE
jgi:diamine N-acetyltransferase